MYKLINCHNLIRSMTANLLLVSMQFYDTLLFKRLYANIFEQIILYKKWIVEPLSKLWNFMKVNINKI